MLQIFIDFSYFMNSIFDARYESVFTRFKTDRARSSLERYTHWSKSSNTQQLNDLLTLMLLFFKSQCAQSSSWSTFKASDAFWNKWATSIVMSRLFLLVFVSVKNRFQFFTYEITLSSDFLIRIIDAVSWTLQKTWSYKFRRLHFFAKNISNDVDILFFVITKVFHSNQLSSHKTWCFERFSASRRDFFRCSMYVRWF